MGSRGGCCEGVEGAMAQKGTGEEDGKKMSGSGGMWRGWAGRYNIVYSVCGGRLVDPAK